MLQYGQELGAASEFGNFQQNPCVECDYQAFLLVCCADLVSRLKVALFQVWAKLCTRSLRPEMLWM